MKVLINLLDYISSLCILGRAGMVAIGGESDLSVDFRKLYDGVKQKLPSYARPYFVRIVSETDMTGKM